MGGGLGGLTGGRKEEGSYVEKGERRLGRRGEKGKFKQLNNARAKRKKGKADGETRVG